MKKIKRLLIIILVLVLLPISINTNKSHAETDKTYRALLIGNGEYISASRLLGPPHDLPRMKEVLERSKFEDTSKPIEVRTVKDAKKIEMLEAIEKTFQDAKEGDVSYFYFGGHGISLDGEAYIMGIDRDQDEALFSSRELKEVLDRVQGTKVVILDSCFSGGFIDRGTSFIRDGSAIDNNKSFNHIMINTFKEDIGGLRPYSLGGNDYKIITAASEDEYSFELIGDPEFEYGGEFTTSFIRGAGYNGDYQADKNKDGIVTLKEIYIHTLINVKNSLVQVYPNNDTFPIVGYDLEGEDPIEVEGNAEINNNVTFNIKFQGRGKYKINIINSKRQIIYTEIDLEGKPGINEIVWNGKDNQGNEVEDGLYTLEIEISDKDRVEFSFNKESKLEDLNIKAMKIGSKLEEIRIPVILKKDGKVTIDIYNKDQLIGSVVDADLLAKDTLKEYIVDKVNYDLNQYDIKDIDIKINIY